MLLQHTKRPMTNSTCCMASKDLDQGQARVAVIGMMCTMHSQQTDICPRHRWRTLSRTMRLTSVAMTRHMPRCPPLMCPRTSLRVASTRTVRPPHQHCLKPPTRQCHRCRKPPTAHTANSDAYYNTLASSSGQYGNTGENKRRRVCSVEV